VVLRGGERDAERGRDEPGARMESDGEFLDAVANADDR
jgi:hypothetical protein